MTGVRVLRTLADLIDQSSDGDWRDLAVCAEVGPTLFFPEQGESVREAKQVCASCPVRKDCLEYALDNGLFFGVWGGTTEGERRTMMRDPHLKAHYFERRVVRLLRLRVPLGEIAQQLGKSTRTIARVRARHAGELGLKAAS